MPIYCSCIRCKSNLATSQLSNHYGSQRCLNGGKQTVLTECPYCHTLKEDIFKDFPNHVKFCSLNPNVKNYKNGSGRPYINGRSAWNKGLTKETSNSLLKASNTMKERGFGGWSKLASSNGGKAGGGYRANAGRSKKFKVNDSFGKITTLQSTYELKCSEILNELNIKWLRPKSLKYDGKNYFADFYLPDFNIYLDPKNDYKAMLDEDKISKVIEQNNIKLYVLLKENLTKEYIAQLAQ